MLGSYTINREVKPRLVEQLVQVNIDGAGNRTNLFGHSRREREVVCHVAADDLNVNRGRQTKVQDLGDDISGLKKNAVAGRAFGNSSRNFCT